MAYDLQSPDVVVVSNHDQSSSEVFSLQWLIRRNKLPLSFWLLGVLNNSPYVIMLASAKSISEGGTALVFIANVIPSLIIKISAPYWFDRVSYHIRLISSAILMGMSFGIVALFSSSSDDHNTSTSRSSENDLLFELLGVALASAQCGLGEASLLALAGRCDSTTTEERNTKKKCITCFSSGTGLAGVFGFLWKFVWNDWLRFSMKQTLWLAIPSLAITYAYVYVKNLWHVNVDDYHHAALPTTTTTSLQQQEAYYQEVASQVEDDNNDNNKDEMLLMTPVEIETMAATTVRKQQDNGDDDWEDEYENNEQQQQQQDSVSVAVQKVQDMSTKQRLRLVLSLYPYMIPLFVVYAAEYALQAGTWTAIGFPVNSQKARDEFYEYSNWMYQIGVFLSRSSGTIYTAPMSVLWLMPMLQMINVVFFCWIAAAGADGSWLYSYGLLVPCFYVGLLGGAVYVNGYTRICADLPLEHREFALSSTSVAEGFGIMVADLLGLFIQSCLYRVHGLEGAVVSCPIR